MLTYSVLIFGEVDVGGLRARQSIEELFGLLTRAKVGEDAVRQYAPSRVEYGCFVCFVHGFLTEPSEM